MSRIILKISGEALKDDTQNISNNKLDIVLKTVQYLRKNNHFVGIVVGGGNFFRGRENPDMNKVTADTIGMLGTVMNALYLKDYFSKNAIDCVVSTPFVFPGLLDNLSDEELKDRYEDGKVVIFGGGVGKSGYSTDSGTILASEKLDSNLIIKMTNVDGVYSSDPRIDKDAIKYDRLTYKDVIDNKLQVMDEYAIKKCMENKIKILVIDFNDYEKIDKFFNNDIIGTIIGD